MANHPNPQILLETCATSALVTGLERVGQTLRDHLKGRVCLSNLTSQSNTGLIKAQYVDTPLWLARNKRGIVVPVTFPPSLVTTLLYPGRVIPYIHDLYLVDGTTVLTLNARLYMAPAFKQTLKRCSLFLANSEVTRDRLRIYCNLDADVKVLRPIVDDVFDLSKDKPISWVAGQPLHLVTVGTVEPRKGLLRAARLRAGLEESLGSPVILDVVGRRGWGPDWDLLTLESNVRLHGYLTPSEVRRLITGAHIFVSASYDEGLGLPLLEVQHGSKIVIASDIPTYREVLGESGLLVDFDNPTLAAENVVRFLEQNDIAAASSLGKNNVARWNDLAYADIDIVATMLNDRIKDAST